MKITLANLRGVKLVVKSCPNCKNNVSVDSRCFDCKQVIQWICYKCQWESNIRDHISCHKIIAIPAKKFSQDSKFGGYSSNSFTEKSHDLYWWTLRQVTQVLA